ncbi:hypothetical protein B0H16DRAFT_1454365 [Mycena metata]|uniref:Uncharacterized protein n=1 Tax=Mycena metata TaxID=1033252 RepID=A0AAD7JJE6_9AGAR|nr:hypothetical protein B0H16DRAFT_1454365 [Mycena metata]
MSTIPPPKLVKTNVRAEELVMDIRGGRDSRYYCIPPYHGAPEHASTGPKSTNGYPFHLVAQGHIVIFDTEDRPAAKASLTGYPDSSNAGYFSVEECIDAWQRLCDLGVHPHPPSLNAQRGDSASAVLVNTSPRKMKREATPNLGIELDRFRNGVGAGPSVSASPPPSPQKKGGEARRDVNFAIRGAGIVSSSAARSEERYLELQRRGEEPDILVTRNFERASCFALEDVQE